MPVILMYFLILARVQAEETNMKTITIPREFIMASDTEVKALKAEVEKLKKEVQRLNTCGTKNK